MPVFPSWISLTLPRSRKLRWLAKINKSVIMILNTNWWVGDRNIPFWIYYIKNIIYCIYYLLVILLFLHLFLYFFSSSWIIIFIKIFIIFHYFSNSFSEDISYDDVKKEFIAIFYEYRYCIYCNYHHFYIYIYI